MAGPLDAPFLTIVDTLLGIITTGKAGGTSAQISRPGAGFFNKEDDSLVMGQPTVYDVVASPPQKPSISDNKAEAVQGEKMTVIVAAKNLTIVPNEQTDTYLFGGKAYEIYSVSPLYSGASVCAYQLVLIR